MIYKYSIICLMALLALFVIHLLIIKLNYAEVSATNGNKNWASSDSVSHDSLYSASDKVVLLTAENFNENVYNSSSGWMVEFYNSWCGHCIKFAPVWKQLAADIYNWRSVVTISGIDCAEEENTQLCRDYEIMGYPTIRYFKPAITAFTLGEDFVRTHDEVSVLRDEILLKLEATELEGTPKNWPRLLPISSVRSLWDYGDSNITVLVVEKNNSFVGRTLIMDMINVSYVPVRRILHFSFESYSTLPEVRIETRDQSSSVVVKPVNLEDRQKLFYSVGDLLKSRNYTVFDVFVNNHMTNEEHYAVKQSPTQQMLVNMVFQEDLESALSYSLFHEIPLKPVIADDRLIALTKYLRIIHKYFPFDYETNVFVQNMINDLIGFEKLTGGQFKDILWRQGKKFQQKPRHWVSCKGSSSKYRGYPCGLWMMFHTLTVKAYISNINSMSNGIEVLDAMSDYIKYFFGCQDCSEHFQQMSKTIAGNVTTSKDSVLWLWRAHNNVNKRLAGDGSEDSSFPKVQFPRKDVCPQCKNMDDSWNEEKVLSYLVNMYSNVHWDSQQNVSSAHSLLTLKEEEHDWYFGIFNMNICIALYILSACLLTIYTIWFFMNGNLLSRPHKYDFSIKV